MLMTKKIFPKIMTFSRNNIFQNAKCDNHASMRMFGGERPFTYIRSEEITDNPLIKVFHQADEAS